MNFDKSITEELTTFVNSDKESRDYQAGALLLARISGNTRQYNMIIGAGPEKYADFIDSKLSQYLKFRLAKITHEQTKKLKDKAEKIVSSSDDTEKKIYSGKRDDHDSLPEEMQAAYAETLSILQKQRDLHAKIRHLALHEATCPDSELFPFVSEIVELDKKRLNLWHLYDNFKPKSEDEQPD